MSSTTQTQSPNSGCGGMLTILVAAFFLMLGLVVGAGGLFVYLSNSDTGLTRLGLIGDQQSASDAAEPYPFAHPLAGSTEITDALDDDEVRARLVESRELFQRCYADALDADPTVRGEIRFQVTVNGDTGDVVGAVVREDNIENDRLVDCITSGLQSEWSFSAPETSRVQNARFSTLFLPMAAQR